MKQTFFISKRIIYLFLLGFVWFFTQACTVSKSNIESDKFRFNQIGFYPSEKKIAIIIDKEAAGKDFYIKNASNGEIIYTGKASPVRLSTISDKQTVALDFTKVDISGKYFIEIPAIGKSTVLTIQDNILTDVTAAAFKAFYYQRSGISIDKQYAGIWNREIGHLDDQVMIHPSAVSEGRSEGTIISSSKGWYDAGDYNKYIVNSGFTVATLLSLYEDFPDYVKKINLNIPESTNNTPDLLDEVYWNLDWMLTMQDPTDGGVYHKLTTPSFEGFIKPSECKQQRYVVAKSVTAALDFAASMAQAARIFSGFEKDYPNVSEKMLAASRRAFDWAQKNPALFYNQKKMNEQFQPSISTGEYGDGSAKDEFYWASVELYLTTGEEKYLSYAEQYSPTKYTIPVWSDVDGMGVFSLIRYAGTLRDERAKELAGKATSFLLAYADSVITSADQSPYAAPYGRDKKDFFWGCNSDAASNQGITLIYAWLLTKNRDYITYTLHNMDYILGRNATGYCYITGYGYKSPMNPHHRLSASDSIEGPIPGFLVGGPNPGKQDKCDYPSDFPDECYADVLMSYASNEIAINWQGLFSYFSAALDASIE